MVSLFSPKLLRTEEQKYDKEELESIDKDFEVESLKLKKVLVDKLYQLVGGKSSKGIKNVLGEEVISKSVKFTQKVLMQLIF